ncbi:hypothetical protein LEMLEM_LOCUS26124, partial [Lemmus lemmus]
MVPAERKVCFLPPETEDHMLGVDMKGTPYWHLEDKFLTTLKCQPHVELLTEDSALHSPHQRPVPDCLCPDPSWSSLEGSVGAVAGPKLRLQIVMGEAEPLRTWNITSQDPERGKERSIQVQKLQ